MSNQAIEPIEEQTEQMPARTASLRRYKAIAKSTGSATLSKAMALITNALIVPMTVRYLGPEKYGLWITITTTVTMAVILDIGIASTLTNLISEAYARDDKSLARQSFTTAFWSLIGICTLLPGGPPPQARH